MGNPKNIPVALESLICGLVCHRLPAKHPNKRNALRHGNRSLKKEQLQGELWKGAARPTQCVDSCSCCCCTARAWLANDLCSHIPLAAVSRLYPHKQCQAVELYPSVGFPFLASLFFIRSLPSLPFAFLSFRSPPCIFFLF